MYRTFANPFCHLWLGSSGQTERIRNKGNVGFIPPYFRCQTTKYRNKLLCISLHLGKPHKSSFLSGLGKALVAGPLKKRVFLRLPLDIYTLTVYFNLY